MDILNRGLIDAAKKRHSTWKSSLNSWERIVKGASWKNPANVRLTFRSADKVGDCFVFNIAYNDARLIALIDYQMQTVTVLGVMSHGEYDKDRWKNACNC